MRLFWVTAGFAAGYVMGSKAGEERYEQLRHGVEQLMGHPAVAKARTAAMDLAGSLITVAAARAGITVEPDAPTTARSTRA